MAARKPYNELDQKQCPDCGRYKDLIEFGKNSSNWDGKMTYCKECWRIRGALSRGKDPESIRTVRSRRVNKDLLSKGKRQCSYCEEILPLDEFNKDKSRHDGYNARCKSCVAHEKSEYRKRHKEKIKERRRKTHLKRTYGLTDDEYKEMLTAQDFKCAICKSLDPKTSYDRFSVDHCHESNAIRGLLCNPCNVMLGTAYDNPTVLRAGAEYLEKFNGKTT